MAKAKQPVTVEDIEFDALIDSDQTLEAQVPEYAVETGYSVSDGIIFGAEKLSMTLFVTNTPVTWYRRHGSDQSRVDTICKKIEELYYKAKPVTIVTSDATYTDMAIETISIRKTLEVGYAREIPISFKKVRKTAAKRKEENAFIRDEIKILLLFALSVLLLLSAFGVGGAAGDAVSGVLFGLFGLFAYVLPIGLFFVAAFSISNKDNTIAAVKGGAMIAAGFLCCALFQLFGGEKDGAGTAAAFYTFSAEHKRGGGFFGGMICKALKGAFGTAGAWIIVLVLLIICAVVITERSFISGVKKGSRKVYDTAREDARRHRIQAEERRAARQKAMEEKAAWEQEQARKEERRAEQEPEEPKRLRTEHKVSGVALEETTMKKDSGTDEMREITLEGGGGPELQDLDEMFRIPIHRERSVCQEAAEPEEAEKQEQIRIDKAAVRDMDISPETPQPPQKTDPELPLAAQKEENAASVPPQAGGAVREDGQSRPAFQPPRRRAYIYPPVRLLNHVKHKENRDADRILHETALHLQQILRDFGVGVTVTDVSQGPAVTRYELQPDQGVKVSKIVSLADDIKLNLAVSDVRIEAPIPGKAAVGIEVPNAENAIVPFRELVSSQEFKNHKSKLAFAVGKDIAGKIVVTDIAKMPHLLIAGATGSGKSVCINTLIMSLLYKASPDEVKLIMIDPKVVELSVYNGIPHLLIPVVTDPKKAAGALNWAVAEMTHLPSGPAGPGGGHPSGDRDPEALCQCHYGPHQGEHALQNRLRGILRSGFQDDSRHERSGKAAGKGRYAVLSVWLSQTGPGAGRLCLGRGGGRRGRFPEGKQQRRRLQF